MGDGPHFSPDFNDTGDPAIWRRLSYSDDYGQENSVWTAGAYVDVYNDGRVGVFSHKYSNDRLNENNRQEEAVSLILEFHFMRRMPNGDKTIRFDPGATFVVMHGLVHNSTKYDQFVVFAPGSDTLSLMSRSWGFVAYRKIPTLPPPRGDGIYFPIPVPDPTGG